MKPRPFDRNTSPGGRKNPGSAGFRLPPLPGPPAPREKERTCRDHAPARHICTALLIVSLLLTQGALADDSLLRGPRKVARQGAETVEQRAVKAGILEGIAAAPVLFYRRFLGPSWGRKCQYHPSCSNYALLAIAKHGAVVGSIMAFDRLQHEANEVRYSPRVVVGGEIKVYDPLENNDYWWYNPDRSESAAPAGAGRVIKP